ncbi:unnamed protein product, partial [Meganyctiphanes norvegica]
MEWQACHTANIPEWPTMQVMEWWACHTANIPEWPTVEVPVCKCRMYLALIGNIEPRVSALTERTLTMRCVQFYVSMCISNYNVHDFFFSSAEAIHLANLLCQYGYFFPVGESRSLIVKDDSSLYRFQTPYYWPSQNHSADTTDYAIYLTKRLSRNKQKHGLEDYEMEAYNKLKKALHHKWDFITMQAEEQVKLAKERKKGDKIVTDSQERAYWRVYRPPPGFTNCLEVAPVPDKTNMANRVRKKTIAEIKDENVLLTSAVIRTRQKVSQAIEGLITICETYFEYDPMLVPTQPSNPWVSDDISLWILNESYVEVPTEKRVRRWGLSMEELISDVTGNSEFATYLRKEYSHENIRFIQAVTALRWGPKANVEEKVREIYEEFLKPGAPCEINIDGKTMEVTQQLMKTPSRYTYQVAADHVYILLLKKDCYPRFLRSEQYKTLLANAIQPSQRKRPNSMLFRLMGPTMMMASGQNEGGRHPKPFFNFPHKKKASTTIAPNNISATPQPLKRHGSDSDQATMGFGDGGIHGSTGINKEPPKVDCDPPYRGDLHSSRNVVQSKPIVGLIYCAGNYVILYKKMTGSYCSSDKKDTGTSEGNNICPWDTQAPPAKTPPKQQLTNPKQRPDRSKSMDVSSLSKRHGSVSVAPNLVPAVVTEEKPQTNICPWEQQELPNRQEKSKSVDVDSYPWEVAGDPIKKASTASTPGVPGNEGPAPTQTGTASASPCETSINKGAIIGVTRDRGEGTRPVSSERKVSISISPWEEVVEEEPEYVASIKDSTTSISTTNVSTSNVPIDKPRRRASESSESRDKATKPKDKHQNLAVSGQFEKPYMTAGRRFALHEYQINLELNACSGGEGTSSSPSSSCSSSSYGDTRGRIKIDYTVRSGHLPGQYGLPLVSPVGSSGSGTVSAVLPTMVSQSSSEASISATSTANTSYHKQASLQPQQSVISDSGIEPCGNSIKPVSPVSQQRAAATSLVAPWEEDIPPQQTMTDICPWEDEENCRVDAPFVKTYATLGYL